MELDFTTFNENYENYEVRFNQIVIAATKLLKIKANLIISATIVDNEFIHNINRDYRNVDRETDVISFAFLDDCEDRDAVLKKKGDVVLGEIYISYEKAISQAKEYGHSLEREMSFLFVHGLLHLLGYDHMTKEEEEIMFPLQEKILSKITGGLMDTTSLVKKAIEARKLSYSPYSHFAVGAVLLCKDGSEFKGSNIENAAYGLCMCAERNAIYNAMMNGKTKDDFVALALSADTPTPCSPCGACRQVISELLPRDAKVIMSNLKGDIQEVTVEELLPFAFSEEDLNK